MYILYSILLYYYILLYIILYYIMLYYTILYLLYILYYIYIDYVYVCIYRPKNFDNILKQMMVNKLYKSIQNKWKGSLTNWNGRKRWFFRNRKGMKRDLNKQIWGQHWFWAIKVTNIAMNINKYIYIYIIIMYEYQAMKLKRYPAKVGSWGLPNRISATFLNKHVFFFRAKNGGILW